MNPVSAALILGGGALALLAGVGVLRFRTSYARLHAAGKASPVAFIMIATGAAIETGWEGAAKLAVAVAALVLTLPVAVHLLFRAVHRTTPNRHLRVDDLRRPEHVAQHRDEN